ncbi:hypothetical protein MUP65_00140 [Patescibacteria group bacterium]|nr:hypothetical protein [Patescibacteria group bacterium]
MSTWYTVRRIVVDPPALVESGVDETESEEDGISPEPVARARNGVK